MFLYRNNLNLFFFFFIQLILFDRWLSLPRGIIMVEFAPSPILGLLCLSSQSFFTILVKSEISIDGCTQRVMGSDMVYVSSVYQAKVDQRANIL